MLSHNSPPTFSLRVYMEDTDAQGHVYFVNYLKFGERARTEFLKDLGIPHATLMQEGKMFVVHACHLTCQARAYLGETLQVHTSVNFLKGARLDLHQVVRRDQDLIATMNVELAFVGVSGKPLRLPEDMRALLVQAAAGSA